LSKPWASDFKYQALVTAVLFLGLFFVEYPPLFLIGYWSWGYWPHKILSGVFIALNLYITQYSVRHWGFFKRPRSVDSEKLKKPTS